MYTITYSRSQDLLDITWSGLFTPAEMRQYEADCGSIWKKEGFKAGFRMRIVLTDDKPLPQETLAVLGQCFADFPAPGRTAMVTNSALVRMQIKRAMMVPGQEIFDTPDAALEWLLAD